MNTATTPDVCLTLVAAREIEEMIIDVLLEHDDIVRRFGTHPLDAHGARIGYASVAERVRGRAERSQFELLMANHDTPRILDALRARLPRADISYWITPVLAYGRLA
ncbi:DUF3240 family protein [Rhodocyclus tenuis]|uniref:DUF3240 domain-containing protein n=2 Tax=Rhodocyclus TaxID=1064 RepID=A0A6L5JUT7_RHOTE|nr:DUF3240 family protein [Rhodocyclus gracilis]MQY50592.1 DUF3240 domain-containing protein [Rhodocyclus gracilis]MRD72595.1 DUF3240 domain-containing protein [Rhodocyclus gracilis]NJA88121.1 DUF3240 family protein [Rhodocyclus gracilis]